ncbi:MAG: hypothetical protein ACR2HG_08675 [Pyrinomonadaceae bacterium]
MPQTPKEVLQTALAEARRKSLPEILNELSDEAIRELKIVADNAESLKAVLGVTLTSLVYKIYQPAQDIRFHQENMRGGYSGRTFDTKFVTPFLQNHFPHFAMAESAWLTRSLEQPFPYTLDYGGKIRNKQLKAAFLNLLDRLQSRKNIAEKLLVALFALLLEKSAAHESLFAASKVLGNLTISKIIEAVGQHIFFRYGVSGAARLPVLAIYAVYELLTQDVKRYENKTLAPLESHTSPDSRSKALGDIEVLNADGDCFEAVEIKHGKPVTAGMLGIVFRKIQNESVERYYILTTREPNTIDADEVVGKLTEIGKTHSCQIIVNGVLPSLKYYLRLISKPENFIDLYARLLESEFNRASGIKSEHLKVGAEIRQNLL